MAGDAGSKCSDSTGSTDGFRPPETLPAWSRLVAHAERLRRTRLKSLFDADPDRFGRLSLQHERLVADFSRHRIDEAVRLDLLALAEESGLRAAIHDLFAGAPVNFTERRPALHMAMRGGCALPEAELRPIQDTTERMRGFARELREQRFPGATGKPIQHVVNLGIGGSDLGPRLAVEALSPSHEPHPIVRFVANIDPLELDEALADADPERTLFIVSSKSFATAETMENADRARQWLAAGLGRNADLGRHFAAVSNATAHAVAFGIDPERVFALPEWIGGRYSVWSAIGLPLMIAIGEEAFDRFLTGARAIDEHFRDAPPHANIPVMMALAGIWNTDFLGIETLAVLPYAHGLRTFPAWLQQLEMESNGKSCRRDGSTSTVPTAPVIWGGPGTVGQHAFHQLLYQGTRPVAIDFIVPVGGSGAGQRALVDNALAQGAALMEGRDLEAARQALRSRGLPPSEIERLAPHLVCPGDQPSTTLLLPELAPFELGRLLALYEHKVFVQGWIWGIDSFDQYGVELGKEMALGLSGGTTRARDASTTGLIAAAEALRSGR